MRVTENILFSNFLYNINKINSKTYKTNSQMSSGRRLLNLDSDPISLMKVLSLKDIQKRFEQYTTNINSATSVLDAQDTTLNNADTLLQKADTLLIQGANAVNSDQTSRQAIAQQIDSIKEEIIDSANTIFEGKYLFAGLKTDTQPIEDKPQAVAITHETLSNPSQVVEINTTDVYKDVNQFKDGSYTAVIKDSRLYLCKNNCNVDSNGIPTNPIPIDNNSEDNSNVGGNFMSNYIDLTQDNIKDKINKNGWIDTGRGIKIRLKDMDFNNLDSFSATIGISYTAGGKSVYMGDDGHRDVEYSDSLTSPITLNAKEIYKPTNQTLQNSNYMIDKSTDDPVTDQSKLTDIALNEALSRVELQTGSTITINGKDHNGNFVSGQFSVSSNSRFEDLINYVKTLDSVEMQQNNAALRVGSAFAASSNTLQSAGIQSTIVIFGKSNLGSDVAFSIANTASIHNMLSSISSKFHVQVSLEHGIIKLKGENSKNNSLKIYAQTKVDKKAVLGSFIETSKGAAGGFHDTVDGYVKNGHLLFEDERPGKSKFDISFSLQDSSGSPESNIFGVFNTKTYGKGVDIFKELRSASSALLNRDELNQIGKPTQWQKGSSYDINVYGKYRGGIDNRWSVKIESVSQDMSQNGSELKIGIVDKQGNVISNVDLVNNNGEYELTVTNKDGIIIQHEKNSDMDSLLHKVVVETSNYQSIRFKNQINGVNGNQGVTLNLSKINNSSSFQMGDEFSFDVSDSLERAIGKIEDSLNQVLTARAVVGARTNRMSLAKERIDSITVTNSKTISELEDANIAEVFADFQRNQIVMQATLNAGSKITSNNLFDYLR